MFKEVARRIGLVPQEISVEDRKYMEFTGKFADWLVAAGFIGQRRFGLTLKEDRRVYNIVAGFDGKEHLMIKVIADSFSPELNIDEYWEYNISRNSSNVYLYHERILFKDGDTEVNWGEYIKGEPYFERKGLSTLANEDVFKAFEDLMKIDPTGEFTSLALGRVE